METLSALLALCAGNSPVPVNSPHKGQWCGALMFSLIWAWINDWVNNCEAGDLRCHHGHYDVIVMWTKYLWQTFHGSLMRERHQMSIISSNRDLLSFFVITQLYAVYWRSVQVTLDQAGKLKNFGTRRNWVVSYIAYATLHSPRPVYHMPGQIFTRIGERASASFPACGYFQEPIDFQWGSWKYPG